MNCSTSSEIIELERRLFTSRFFRRDLLATLFLLLLIALPFSAIAQATNSANDADSESVVFVPPAIGVPSERIGAGTRNLASSAAGLKLLVPEGGGLTTSPKPLLVWELEEEFSGEIHAQIVPIQGSGQGGGGVGKSLQGRFPAGYYALDLYRPDLSIVSGEIYRWTVSLVDVTTNQIVTQAEGLVERVEPSDEAGSPAQQGLWFDAIVPFLEVDFTGRARLVNKSAYVALAASAGVE